MDVVMWTAVRQEDFPECSGGLAVPAIDNCGLRQDSRRTPMLGRVYSCKEQRQMYMSRNAQQTAFTLRKPPGGCSDVACITSTIVCVVHERNATKSLTIIRTRPAAVKRICINTHVRMTLVP